jgi:CTP:molybdopterin cytidylyltransferase MocA
MVPGAVLAAGKSARMGRSKALLRCGPSRRDTFLDRIVAAMREGGVDDVLVIGRPDDRDLIDAVLQPAISARFVANPNHERGQITSIVCALNAIDHPGVGGLLVIPVDMPLVKAQTFAAVLQAAAAHPRTIVRAAHRGRHGHPVVFDRGSFDALRHADPATGAKAVLRDRADRMVNVEVSDAGVLTDIDTVEDYVAAFGRPPDSWGAAVSS